MKAYNFIQYLDTLENHHQHSFVTHFKHSLQQISNSRSCIFVFVSVMSDSKPHAYYFVPRKPVLADSEPGFSLHRTLTRSRSSLWRGWSPGLPSFTEYERTAYKFPWLQNPVEESGSRHPGIILETSANDDRSHLLSHDDTQAGPSAEIPLEEKPAQGIRPDDPEDPELVCSN